MRHGKQCIFLFIIISTILVQSCYSIKETIINNNCNKPIEVGIQFDEQLFRFCGYNGENQVDYISKRSSKDNIDLIDIDATNYYARYSIQPDDSLTLKAGLKIENEIKFIFDSLTIIKDGDTIYIGDKELQNIMTTRRNNIIEFTITNELFY